MWSQQQIKQHISASKKLNSIKDNAFNFIKANPDKTEYDVQQFIIRQIAKKNLVSDKFPPIVSFNENTSNPEHHPPKRGSKKIKKNTLIMIDLWARENKQNSPFADMTWIAFYGKTVPFKIQKVFEIIVKARTELLNFLKSQLKKRKIPTGKDADLILRKIIIKGGFEKNIMHETGHSLGTIQDHGPKPNWIYKKNSRKLCKNLGYTIEPAIYIKNKFGLRSEIDFYITENFELKITTKVQEKIIKL